MLRGEWEAWSWPHSSHSPLDMSSGVVGLQMSLLLTPPQWLTHTPDNRRTSSLLSLQCPKRNISQNQTSLFIRIRVQSLRETRQRIRHASGPVITHSSHVMFQTTVNVNMLSSTSLMCFYKGWLSVCNMFQVCGFRKKKVSWKACCSYK